MNVRQAVDLLEHWFPRRLAEPWDNVGLLLGDEASPVRRVMTCLTLTGETAREAIDEKVDLVISHHPIFFKKINRLVASGPDAAAYELARAGIALFSPHTAFDSAAEGINDQIAKRLGLTAVRPLRAASQRAMNKLVVFVPASDLDSVSAAIFQSGGGRIGEYSECSFRVTGTGTFCGSEYSQPTIGKAGRREEVAEHRLEVLVPSARLDDVIQAMIAAHSYETPAYDVYPLQSTPDVLGSGRIGDLPDDLPLDLLARRVKSALSSRAVEVVGSSDRCCRRVAIGCGSAAEFLSDANEAGCDVLVTGEARFHDALSAREQEIGLVLAGHYATERFALETLADRLAAAWPGVAVWSSRDESDPIRNVE